MLLLFYLYQPFCCVLCWLVDVTVSVLLYVHVHGCERRFVGVEEDLQRRRLGAFTALWTRFEPTGAGKFVRVMYHLEDHVFVLCF